MYNYLVLGISIAGSFVNAAGIDLTNFSSPLADTLSGYNLGGESKQAPSFLESTIIEAPVRPVREKLVFKQEVRSDWKNIFAELCAKQATEWGLKDEALLYAVRFGLMNEPSFVQQIIEQRKKTIDAWNGWRQADNKEGPRQTLARAVEKNLKKFPGNTELMAKQIIDTDIGGDPELFRSVMLKNITTLPAYHFLLLSILGYTGFSSNQYHTEETRRINGVGHSDQETLRAFFALLVAAYRAEYDAQYPAVCESYAVIPFMSETNKNGKDMEPFEKAEYLQQQITGEFADRWSQLILRARSEAHQEATRVIKDALEKLRMAVVLFQARLEVIRVPVPPLAESATEAQIYSVLLGCLCRAGQRVLLGKENILMTNGVPEILLQEYKDQMSLQRISNVPGGETGVDEARAAFESVIASLFGSIDLLRFPILKPAIVSALNEYKVDQAVELYKKISLVSAYVNGVVWGISPKTTDVYRAFTQTLQLARGYIEKTLLLDIGSAEALNAAYAQARAAVFGKGPNKYLTTKSRIDVERLSKEQIQGVYKTIWLCIGARLVHKRVATKSVAQADDAASLGAASAVESGAGNRGGPLDADMLPAAIVDNSQDSLSPTQQAMRRMQDNFSQFGQRMGSRVGTVMNDVKAGSRENLAAGLTDALSDTGEFINSLQSMIATMYKQSDHLYSRMHATFKALTLYTHYLNEYATRKIQNYKKVIDDLLQGLVGKMGMPVIRFFLERTARKARITANQDEDRLLRKVNIALQDLKLAIAGKKTLRDLPDIPTASVLSANTTEYDISSTQGVAAAAA